MIFESERFSIEGLVLIKPKVLAMTEDTFMNPTLKEILQQ
jgi:hypothetical protein